MRLYWAIVVAALVGPWPGLAVAEQPGRSAAAIDAQAARWFADLDSASFAAREAATRRLTELGQPAIAPLAAIDDSAGLEQIRRTLLILATLAVEGNAATQVAAGEALERLTRSSDERLAHRARDAFEAYLLAQQQTTIAKIEEMGGRVERLGDEPQGAAIAVSLGLSWRGGTTGIDYLKALPELESVALERSELGDAALPHLARLTQLKKLYLGNSRITGRGLEQLKPLAELHFLSLRGLTLDMSALDTLPLFKQLDALGLDNTNVTDADLPRLAPLTGLETLWLNGTKVSDAGLKHLEPLTGLVRLELAGTGVNGSELARLKRLPRLAFLTLENTALDDAGAVQLGQITQLRKLGLDRTKIGDAGVAKLAGLKNLETLWLDHTGLSDEGLEALAGLPNLVLLHAEQTKITTAGAKKLQSVIPRLRVAE